MNGIDKLFRARIEEWLSKESHTADELAQGATMMLQCNRNMAMYNTVMRKLEQFEGKIAYELRKNLRYLQDGVNLEGVKDMEKHILPVIDNVIATTNSVKNNVEAAGGYVAEDACIPSPDPSPAGESQKGNIIVRGKRGDHDTLPEAIRSIWDKNAERWKKMKQAHETAKTLSAACDRYEFVKALAELWDAYKKDFDTYDHYVLLPVDEEAATLAPAAEGVQLSADDIKDINAARPYISKNLPKLLALVVASKEEGFTDKDMEELKSWRSRIQQRVDVLIRTGQVIGDEVRLNLSAAGIMLEKTESDGQGQGHSEDSPAAE
jgi:hypothetical protein